MALNTAPAAAATHRREMVARLRLRGYTQREIVAELERQAVTNPSTQKPYSLGIINRDLQQLTEGWQQNAEHATADHRALLLAELREVRRAAWDGAGRPDVVDALVAALDDGDATVRAAAARSLGAVGQPDLTNVLKAAKQEADLLGLDAPQKVEHSGEALVKIYQGVDLDRV